MTILGELVSDPILSTVVGEQPLEVYNDIEWGTFMDSVIVNGVRYTGHASP